MIYIYIMLSLILCVVYVKLARKIGSTTRRESIIYLFFVLEMPVAVSHYRVFMNGELGALVFEAGLLLDISSFLFFTFMCVVPVTVLRKAIVKNEDRLLK